MADPTDTASSIDAELARRLLPSRADEDHKGSFGHLVVVAGSRGMAGAVHLVCEAAYRSGAGLVSAAVPAAIGDVVATHLVEAMTNYLPDTSEGTFTAAAVAPLLEFIDGKKAVALGPGLSQHEDTGKFVREFLVHCDLPLILDADGLNAVGRNTETLTQRRAPTVLTPHPGEMGRLTGKSVDAIQSDRIGTAVELATTSGCVVVLKGAGTVVAHPEGAHSINTTGNSGMGTGGTGDVLSGIIGGLLAQGMGPYDAARLAVFVHGRAGDLAADARTARALMARDLIEFLPAAWKTLEQ